MSPYRVLVETVDGKSRVLCAMLSKNKQLGSSNIRIVEKVLPPDMEDIRDVVKLVAHLQSGKRNTIPLAEYGVVVDDLGWRDMYQVINKQTMAVLPHKEYTLSDCLVRAMHDYLNEYGMSFVTSL